VFINEFGHEIDDIERWIVSIFWFVKRIDQQMGNSFFRQRIGRQIRT
jgi:hypothetical protein